MASQQTAAQLVRAVRDDVQIWDRSKLRDGFEKDEGQAPLDILSLINEGFSIALGTGYRKCRFYIPVVADRREYPINYKMGTMEGVWLNGCRIYPKKIAEWGQQYPDFTTEGSVTAPYGYYSDFPDKIGLFPAPNYSDTGDTKSLVTIAEHAMPDLIVEDDIPGRLLEQYHARSRYYASWKTAERFGLTDRASALQADWEKFLYDLKIWAQTPEDPTIVQIVPDVPLGGDWGMDW